MKIHTLTELQDFIDEDFGWRIKELSILLSDVKSTKALNHSTAIRAGIVLLYSHWEGFIKNITEYYLTYVKYQKLSYEKLNYNFVALSLKKKLNEFEVTNKTSLQTETVKYLLTESSARANLPNENIIKTKSNLSSNVLMEVLSTIGIDWKPYELKFNLIDTVLLQNRNTIAHGQYLGIDEIRYEELHKDIIDTMRDIKTQILNASVLKEYERK